MDAYDTSADGVIVAFDVDDIGKTSKEKNWHMKKKESVFDGIKEVTTSHGVEWVHGDEYIYWLAASDGKWPERLKQLKLTL